MLQKSSKIWSLALLVAIIAVGLWLRLPSIRSGMPYFYDEDEAHHFNRVVNMVKAGRFDPDYFHKPSLHFYLRMPIVAVSFVKAVKAGELKSLSEITTKDPFGVGDYAFSASHPRIVKWNRAFSVFLSLLCIGLTYGIGTILSQHRTVGIGAALITALSPALVNTSSVIGVDVVMSFFVLLTTFLALKFNSNTPDPSKSLWQIFTVGLFAGLAISSKYNAAPIITLPILLALYLEGRKPSALLLAIITPCIGFIIGSPFLLLNIPKFLDQLAYEVWHYGVAGHEGHQGEPGLAQAMFFLNWLAKDGVGTIALILACIGNLWLLMRRQKNAPLFLAFPVLYFILMSDQRANFTRNILVLIPFVAIAAISLLKEVSNKLPKANQLGLVLSILVLASLELPDALNNRTSASSITESRLEAATWLEQHPISKITAIAGNLQFVSTIYKSPNYTRFDDQKTSIDDLIKQGAGRFVIGTSKSLTPSELEKLELETKFNGATELQRIVNNPELRIFKVK